MKSSGLGYGSVATINEKSSEILGSMKGMEYFDQLSDYFHVKKGFVPWNLVKFSSPLFSTRTQVPFSWTSIDFHIL